MTRISLLEDQKAIFTTQEKELKLKREDIYVREQQAITDTILPFFNQFTPEVEIEVLRGSVYFKMAHPDYSYKKELFNIYLVENWSFDGNENKKSFARVDLSYYTTSTKGIDKWELKRLQMLGAVAEIVLEHQDRILDRVNHAVLPFKAEYDGVYNQMRLVNQAIGELDAKINSIQKEYIESDLKNEGVTFDKGMHIQLKYNYDPYIKFIKLTDFSKSGKKATAVFELVNYDREYKEENVNVEKVINQVFSCQKYISVS